jgi:hypothetical protein
MPPLRSGRQSRGNPISANLFDLRPSEDAGLMIDSEFEDELGDDYD